MVALEDAGAPLWPPHPTMPLYTSTVTHQNHGLHNFQTKRPKIPLEWTIQCTSTQPHIENPLCSSLTMATLMTAHHDILQFTMPLQTSASFPPIQHHNHYITTPNILDHTTTHEQCNMGHTGKQIGHIQLPNMQPHTPLSQHTNKDQREAQHCYRPCGWSLHSVMTVPNDTNTYHHTQTNTASMQMKKMEKSNLHLSHPMLNPHTTDTDQNAMDNASPSGHSLHHNHHYSIYDKKP